MPLLLVDLDNTLIDRASAFHLWARQYVSELAGGVEDVQWLVAADRDGGEDRDRLGNMAAERFSLTTQQEADFHIEVRRGPVSLLVPNPAVTQALRAARQADWVPYVVTNGNVEQQERKLRHTGLDREVAGWVIADGVGVRKPDPRIFQVAAAQAGMTLDGAWMIGDSAAADIIGARNAGIPGIWLHRNRPWPVDTFKPACEADTFADAVEIILAMDY